MRFTRVADVQQGAITWSIFGSQVFFDDVQVLLAFEIAWMVGFVWCFFLKFPDGIYSLFLRSESIRQYSFKSFLFVLIDLLYFSQDAGPTMHTMLQLLLRSIRLMYP